MSTELEKHIEHQAKLRKFNEENKGNPIIMTYTEWLKLGLCGCGSAYRDAPGCCCDKPYIPFTQKP
jgi:hypothetical protein